MSVSSLFFVFCFPKNPKVDERNEMMKWDVVLIKRRELVDGISGGQELS